MDAAKFLASAEGIRLNLRGIYARVIQSGSVRAGDVVRKVCAPGPGGTVDGPRRPASAPHR
jgi:MOSC domain-containing protein YiiM